ncbi:MAG TPA: FADH(2)-oxidizing methylenetetrahydrofolate--tRNA-(uracil(54)-C(5))-methyltransferase TrmFO, partial [Sphingopyxis sp.]|nr:FADH(2)-oxidizing methylenetetrahydrofolate--tRNA-(uracil(54)-C(5))-methyltransferase TrmFO [Sphingopyxis sp.]
TRGGAGGGGYQRMNVNFGLFPPLAEEVRKKDRKLGYTRRAGEALAAWMKAAEGVAV